jgi:hypothetical protein
MAKTKQQTKKECESKQSKSYTFVNSLTGWNQLTERTDLKDMLSEKSYLLQETNRPVTVNIPNQKFKTNEIN